jgi:hypothetical protein
MAAPATERLSIIFFQGFNADSVTIPAYDDIRHSGQMVSTALAASEMFPQ